MKCTLQIFGSMLVLFILAAMPAFSQTVPVSENLWRLVAQEDTDGDQKITSHDHAAQFAIRDQNSEVAETITNFYQMSVLMQELKQADDRHAKNISMNQLQLDEDIVTRTHGFIKDKFWDALTRRIDSDQYRSGCPRPENHIKIRLHLRSSGG